MASSTCTLFAPGMQHFAPCLRRVEESPSIGLNQLTKQKVNMDTITKGLIAGLAFGIASKSPAFRLYVGENAPKKKNEKKFQSSVIEPTSPIIMPQYVAVMERHINIPDTLSALEE